MSIMSTLSVITILLLFTAINAEIAISFVHFNDFHARYEPIDNISALCRQEPCIGGFSRLYATISQLLPQLPNPILLNAGDNFVGTLWHNIYKWNVTQHFMNKLPLDALTIGNHEFDDGLDDLVSFLHHIKSPVVVANIDDSNEPKLQGLYNKSIVLEKSGKKIGIIGAVTRQIFADIGNLNLLDESHSVNREAQNLIESEDIFTNIVLSHCGYETDLKIAKNSVAKISVIVGGHTNTFLYSGNPSPGPDKPSGEYPTVVTNRYGQKVLVVQASAYTKYLGNLTVNYNENGEVLSWSGNPIFLDHTFPTDRKIDQELAIWKRRVDAAGNEVIGSSLFTLLNKPCRVRECIMGNFVTDAMVYAQISPSNEKYWTQAAIAIFHAGGMRAALNKGNITFNDLANAFPFEDTLDVCEIRGRDLLTILERSVTDNRLKYPHIYQVSGIHVTFNISRPEGHRIQEIKLRCRLCNSPKYEEMKRDKYYRIVLPTFLTTTEFEPLFKKMIVNKTLGNRDVMDYMKYLSHRSPLYVEIEERIKFVT